jgi:hypothetical protein
MIACVGSRPFTSPLPIDQECLHFSTTHRATSSDTRIQSCRLSEHGPPSTCPSKETNAHGGAKAENHDAEIDGMPNEPIRTGHHQAGLLPSLGPAGRWSASPRPESFWRSTRRARGCPSRGESALEKLPLLLSTLWRSPSHLMWRCLREILHRMKHCIASTPSLPGTADSFNPKVARARSVSTRRAPDRRMFTDRLTCDILNSLSRMIRGPRDLGR